MDLERLDLKEDIRKLSFPLRKIIAILLSAVPTLAHLFVTQEEAYGNPDLHSRILDARSKLDQQKKSHN